MLPWKRVVAKKEKGSTQSQGMHGNITRIHRKRAIQWAPHPANLYFVRVSHNLCLFHLKLQRWQEELPLCPAWDVQKRKTPKTNWKLAQKWQFLQSTRVEIALLLLGSERQWLFLLSTHFPIIPAQLPSEDEAPRSLEQQHFCPFEFFLLCLSSPLLRPFQRCISLKAGSSNKKIFHKKAGSFWQVLQPSLADARFPDNHQNSWILSEAYLSQPEPQALLGFVLLWFEWASDSHCVWKAIFFVVLGAAASRVGSCTPVPYHPASCACFFSLCCLILCSGFRADTKKSPLTPGEFVQMKQRLREKLLKGVARMGFLC